MIRKIQLIILSAVMAFGATSCLDKYPDDAIQMSKALNTVNDVDQAVLGIYSGFKSSALYSGLMVVCSELQTDLFYAVEGYTNTYGDFWRWEILGNNREIVAVWEGLYKIIGRCNFVLDNAERVRQNTEDDDALDRLEEMLGEVYFARALAYSELIKYFCKAYEPETADKTPGMILQDSFYKPAPKRRASLKASYQFVLDDLERASELIISEAQKNGASADYFTTSAVNALYARVYLYMHEWEKAVEYSTKTIDDPALELATVTTASNVAELYNYMWTNDISTESIWRVSFSVSSYGGALGRVFLNYDQIDYKPDYVPATWMLELYDLEDLRYDSFFANVVTGYPHKLSWALLIKFRGNQTFMRDRIFHVNMPKVFRLSEQYLIRAEANCNLGKYSQAGNDITRLRSKRYTYYGTTSINADNWLEVISEERVRELCMEGFRLHDLKRWHMGFERTPQLHTIPGGSRLKIEADDPLFVWPIPQHELDVPGSEIEPNESNK